MDFRDGQNFIGELGFSHRFTDEGCIGETEIIPELWAPAGGVVGIAVLATLADIVAGTLANKSTAPRVCMTVDLNVRMYGFPAGGNVVGTARVLRTGRTTTVAETLFSTGGETFAISHSTFVASPRPQDVVEIPPGVRRFDGPRLSMPFADRVGCRTIAPGVVEVDRHPDVLNPANTLQGGVIALMAEVAAATAFGEELRVLDELDVRYLAAVRDGPARAEASVLHDGDDGGLVRVEVRDAGNGDRVTAVAAARCAPRPATPG